MRLPRKLLLLVSMVGVFSMLGAGVAFADHTGGTEWTCDDEIGAMEDNGCAPGDRNPVGPAAENALAPVGRHLVPEDAPGHPGAVNGFGNENSNAVVAINSNPLCPFHGVEHDDTP